VNQLILTTITVDSGESSQTQSSVNTSSIVPLQRAQNAAARLARLSWTTRSRDKYTQTVTPKTRL